MNLYLFLPSFLTDLKTVANLLHCVIFVFNSVSFKLLLYYSINCIQARTSLICWPKMNNHRNSWVFLWLFIFGKITETGNTLWYNRFYNLFCLKGYQIRLLYWQSSNTVSHFHNSTTRSPWHYKSIPKIYLKLPSSDGSLFEYVNQSGKDKGRLMSAKGQLLGGGWMAPSAAAAGWMGWPPRPAHLAERSKSSGNLP